MDTHLWALLGATEAGFLVFFAIFVGALAKKYRVTFFSTITAKNFRVKTFCEATTDIQKFDLLKCHPSYYESIRGDVEHWVRDNYETWNEEKPDWFTERVRQRIPKDMIPESEVKKKGEARKEKKRNSVIVVAEAFEEG